MTVFNFHSEPVKNEWLDAYGHLNEAYYLVPLTNATWLMQDHFDIGVDYFDESGCALYTVETHLRYLKEVRKPAIMKIETMILGFDPKKIWFAHSMIVAGITCATAEFMGLHYSTRDNRTIAMPDGVQHKLEAARQPLLPEWVGRNISLIKQQ